MATFSIAESSALVRVEDIPTEDDTITVNTNEDNIPDIPDCDDVGDVMDTLMLALEEACSAGDITPELAFLKFGDPESKQHLDIMSFINKIMAELPPSSIEKITSAVKTSSVPVPPPEDKKVLIKIKKGLQAHEIRQYIKQIDTVLQTKPKIVDVYCEGWESTDTHYSLQPACKKLLQKYSESGLLGCLANNDYQKLAHTFYCSAYVKGKLVKDNVVFQNVDIADYKIKVTDSLKAFWALSD